MIDLTNDRVRNTIRKSIDFSVESPSTSYADSHGHLVELYLDYLLRNYPVEKPPADPDSGNKTG